jgi:hypothetical protein
MRDAVRYAIGFGPLGDLAHRLFVRRDVASIFDFRRDALRAGQPGLPTGTTSSDPRR